KHAAEERAKKVVDHGFRKAMPAQQVQRESFRLLKQHLRIATAHSVFQFHQLPFVAHATHRIKQRADPAKQILPRVGESTELIIASYERAVRELAQSQA